MSFPDLINGLFEAFGFVAVMFSVVRVYKDKKVAGISLVTTIFFTSWGFWNLFYYPHLGQTFSAGAAGLVCLANSLWCALLFYYGRKS